MEAFFRRTRHGCGENEQSDWLTYAQFSQSIRFNIGQSRQSIVLNLRWKIRWQGRQGHLPISCLKAPLGSRPLYSTPSTTAWNCWRSKKKHNNLSSLRPANHLQSQMYPVKYMTNLLVLTPIINCKYIFTNNYQWLLCHSNGCHDITRKMCRGAMHCRETSC